MSGRQGGKLKPLKKAKKEAGEEDEVRPIYFIHKLLIWVD
jgi:hypothetical protein